MGVIRSLLKNTGLTLRDAAAEAGCHHNTLGVVKNPSIRMVIKLLDVCGYELHVVKRRDTEQ